MEVLIICTGVADTEASGPGISSRGATTKPKESVNTKNKNRVVSFPIREHIICEREKLIVHENKPEILSVMLTTVGDEVPPLVGDKDAVVGTDGRRLGEGVGSDGGAVGLHRRGGMHQYTQHAHKQYKRIHNTDTI